MRNTLLLIIFIFCIPIGFSQNIDSLTKVINNSKSDSEKVSVFIDKIINPLKDAGEYEKAISFYGQAKAYCKSHKRLSINLGIAYVEILIAQENYDQAIDSLNKLMLQSIKSKNITEQAKCLRTKALINLSGGKMALCIRSAYLILSVISLCCASTNLFFSSIIVFFSPS